MAEGDGSSSRRFEEHLTDEQQKRLCLFVQRKLDQEPYTVKQLRFEPFWADVAAELKPSSTPLRKLSCCFIDLFNQFRRLNGQQRFSDSAYDRARRPLLDEFFPRQFEDIQNAIVTESLRISKLRKDKKPIVEQMRQSKPVDDEPTSNSDSEIVVVSHQFKGVDVLDTPTVGNKRKNADAENTSHSTSRVAVANGLRAKKISRPKRLRSEETTPEKRHDRSEDACSSSLQVKQEAIALGPDVGVSEEAVGNRHCDAGHSAIVGELPVNSSAEALATAASVSAALQDPSQSSAVLNGILQSDTNGSELSVHSASEARETVTSVSAIVQEPAQSVASLIGIVPSNAALNHIDSASVVTRTTVQPVLPQQPVAPEIASRVRDTASAEAPVKCHYMLLKIDDDGSPILERRADMAAHAAPISLPLPHVSVMPKPIRPLFMTLVKRIVYGGGLHDDSYEQLALALVTFLHSDLDGLSALNQSSGLSFEKEIATAGSFIHWLQRLIQKTMQLPQNREEVKRRGLNVDVLSALLSCLIPPPDAMEWAASRPFGIVGYVCSACLPAVIRQGQLLDHLAEKRHSDTSDPSYSAVGYSLSAQLRCCYCPAEMDTRALIAHLREGHSSIGIPRLLEDLDDYSTSMAFPTEDCEPTNAKAADAALRGRSVAPETLFHCRLCSRTYPCAAAFIRHILTSPHKLCDIGPSSSAKRCFEMLQFSCEKCEKFFSLNLLYRHRDECVYQLFRQAAPLFTATKSENSFP